jgi:AraC-like DNA-binding protein
MIRQSRRRRGRWRLLKTLFDPRAGTRIQQLAHGSYMSIRNYERRFVEDMGISPKLFARLGRFQMALDIKRASGSSWLDVAHELGYFDQMHLVKDFRAFGGDAPSRLVQMCGDFQPWSIGQPMSVNQIKTNGFRTCRLHSVKHPD